jgi:hypothetical protein
MQHAATVNEFDQCKEAVDVQQPCGDLQSLRLHAIDPLATLSHAVESGRRKQ